MGSSTVEPTALEEEAWDALHTATPAGWYVGGRNFHHERNEWRQHAFDPAERAVVGIR